MEDTRTRWDRAFLEALEYDTWGQVEEAIEGYQRLQIAAAAEYVENVLQLPPDRSESIGKLAATLKYRIQELQAGKDHGIGLNGMKALKPFMKQFIITSAKFPLDVQNNELVRKTNTKAATEFEQLPDTSDAADDDDPEPVVAEGGTLRPPPQNLAPGDTTLTLTIEKWGFKDTPTFQEPRILVSVRDERGELLEALQETPVATQRDAHHLFFQCHVYLQTPLNKLPPDAAIFFELRHFKPDKNKKSVKCYCYMEMDELRNGGCTLEVYKKPALYKRTKKPALLTVKDFFLHLDLKIQPYHGR